MFEGSVTKIIKSAKTMLDPFFAGFSEGVKPRARMSLSEWAEAHLVLPEERSASPGPYRVGDATYQRGMMDAVTDPDNECVIAVVPVVGGMVHRGGSLDAASGMQSYTALQNTIAELLDDRTVRGVLLDVDSGVRQGPVIGRHDLALRRSGMDRRGE